MSINQFAMVEELAFLVRDNMPSKYLVLSVEEALISFLQDDTSLDGILELEPMNPYNRLLVHRLAEIFGFAHESVGEGEERHLMLERCRETSVPSILVSDILGQYDESQPLPTSYQLLRREHAPTVLITKVPAFQHTYEEREAAYLAARERIFSFDPEAMREPVRQRSRSVPVVARRMIAHALGQKINPSSRNITGNSHEQHNEQIDAVAQEIEQMSMKTTSKYCHETNYPDLDLSNEAEGRLLTSGALFDVQKLPEEPAKKNVIDNSQPQAESSVNGHNRNDYKEQHLGAAKRIFAQALGRQRVKNEIHSKFG